MSDDGVKWATFDCFGTLVDWHAGFEGIFKSIAGERAAELESAYHEFEAEVEAGPFRAYAEVTRIATERAARKIGLTLASGDADALAAHWDSLPVFRDTRPELRALRDAGWRIGILTNCDAALFERTQPTLGVPLDAVVTAGDVRSYKPSLAHFTAFRDREQPHVWVHVACSWFHDIAPARTLGIPRVWIDRDRTGDDPLAATFVQPTLEGLLDTLERV